MKLKIEVLQDEGPPKYYEIEGAPNDEHALLLAFAMDGGLGAEADWSGCIELAKSYCSIVAWDGKTQAQIETENKEWQTEFDRHTKLWADWVEKNAPGIDHACPSVDHGPEEVAVHGDCFLHLPYDEFWTAGPEGKAYTSRQLTNPTWGQVLVEFEKAIKTTGDYHHSFLEGLEFPEEPEGEVPTIEFLTGS